MNWLMHLTGFSFSPFSEGYFTVGNKEEDVHRDSRSISARSFFSMSCTFYKTQHLNNLSYYATSITVYGNSLVLHLTCLALLANRVRRTTLDGLGHSDLTVFVTVFVKSYCFSATKQNYTVSNSFL